MPENMITRNNAEALIEDQVSREIIEGVVRQSRAMQMEIGQKDLLEVLFLKI